MADDNKRDRVLPANLPQPTKVLAPVHAVHSGQRARGDTEFVGKREPYSFAAVIDRQDPRRLRLGGHVFGDSPVACRYHDEHLSGYYTRRTHRPKIGEAWHKLFRHPPGAHSARPRSPLSHIFQSPSSFSSSSMPVCFIRSSTSFRVWRGPMRPSRSASAYAVTPMMPTCFFSSAISTLSNVSEAAW